MGKKRSRTNQASYLSKDRHLPNVLSCNVEFLGVRFPPTQAEWVTGHTRIVHLEPLHSIHLKHHLIKKQTQTEIQSYVSDKFIDNKGWLCAE